MSKSVQWKSYAEDVDKASVQKYWDDLASREGRRESIIGLPTPIDWKDNVICENEADAVNYILNLDNHNCAQLAVRYKEYSQDSNDKSETISKTIASLEEKMKSEIKKLVDYVVNHSVRTKKAEFISCPKCRSKLNVQYIPVKEKWEIENSIWSHPPKFFDYCPLCEASLWAPAKEKVVNNIFNSIHTINKTSFQLDIDRVKAMKARKYEIKWLVKVVYQIT